MLVVRAIVPGNCRKEFIRSSPLKKSIPLNCGKNEIYLVMKEITMCVRSSKEKVNVNGGQSNVLGRGIIVQMFRSISSEESWLKSMA